MGEDEFFLAGNIVGFRELKGIITFACFFHISVSVYGFILYVHGHAICVTQAAWLKM